VRKLDAAVWLTADMDPQKPSRPDAWGFIRFLALYVAILSSWEIPFFCIGAYPDAHGRSLAERYVAFLQAAHPEHASRCAGHSGKGNNTVHDMVYAVPLIRERLCRPTGWISLVFPTYFLHYLRIVPVCLTFGIWPIWQWSGERSRLPLWKDLLAAGVSWIDWRWSGPLGRRLSRMADQAAEEARQRWERAEQTA